MTRTDRARTLATLLSFGMALGVALGALSPSSAAAEDEAGTEAPVETDAASAEDLNQGPGWEPRLSFGFGILAQPQKGEGQVPTETSSTRLSDSGDSLITQHFEFGLDLLTPVELPVITRPRLVLTSGFQAPISRGLIANRGDDRFNRIPFDPDYADNCPSTLGGFNTSTCDISLRNRTSIDYLWMLGFAVDFTLPIDQEQFHFTQGFEYIGMAAQAEGRYKRRTSAPRPQPPPLPVLPTLIETDFVDAKGDLELYHGISITETFSVDAYEQGPLLWGFYIEGRMSWFATDRDMSVSETNAQGRFNFVSSLNDPEPIQFQLVGGVSVRFDPRLR